MPPRSSVYQLPAALQEELNTRLVGSGFGDYRGLSQWLKDQGFNISKSALHVYGQDFEAEFKASMEAAQKAQKLAKAVVEQSGDTEGAMLEAASVVGQEILLKLMIALRQADHDPDQAAKTISQATRALADLGRMSISQRRYVDQVRKNARTEAGQVAEQAARKAGVSADGIAAIRQAILAEMG